MRYNHKCMGKESEIVQDIVENAVIIRSRRRTMSLEINRDAKIVIRIPMRATNKEISEFVLKNAGWIEKHLQKAKAQAEKDHETPKLTETEINHIMKLAKRTIPKRVEYFAPLVGVDYKRISIRKQHTRWGSCSKDGNLNFNALLMLTPPEVLDSVVVHELCHRLEMNHSKRFYDQVYRICPEYDKYDKWLKENGKTILHRLG